ncbi:MAG TPA: DNA adenine methylase, partial [Nitrospira sp.]|nr:DNA adenine methylase [Nitrospira sp.]
MPAAAATKELSLSLATGEASSGAAAVFRPIQYLGSKLRACSAISDAVDLLTPAGGVVADLFTGTTVVAQTLARAGYRLIAADALAFSATFATALLGVGRPESQTNLGVLLDAVDQFRGDHASDHPWSEWELAERRALDTRDVDALIDLQRTIPVIWRRGSANQAQLRLFKNLDAIVGQNATPYPHIAKAIYAGTYFGVVQAGELDSIRAAIERAGDAHALGSWERAVALTALLAAASRAVCSAGKHFAQPYVGLGDLTPHQRLRLLGDRQVSIRDEFEACADIVLAGARPGCEGHKAYSVTVEELLQQPTEYFTQLPSVVYADPPYT